MKIGSLEWYAMIWDSCHLSLNNASIVNLKYAKQMALKYQNTQYQPVSDATGVPWYVVAGIHMREASFNFRGCLLNGEKIIGTNNKTSIVPKGRGPYKTWVDSAIDALNFRQLNLVTDWSLENTLRICEAYNGRGYLLFHQDVKSPYLWACTDQYSCGLYDSDGDFDPDIMDSGCGIAALLKTLDIEFKRAVLT